MNNGIVYCSYRYHLLYVHCLYFVIYFLIVYLPLDSLLFSLFASPVILILLQCSLILCSLIVLFISSSLLPGSARKVNYK